MFLRIIFLLCMAVVPIVDGLPAEESLDSKSEKFKDWIRHEDEVTGRIPKKGSVWSHLFGNVCERPMHPPKDLNV